MFPLLPSPIPIGAPLFCGTALLPQLPIVALPIAGIQALVPLAVPPDPILENRSLWVQCLALQNAGCWRATDVVGITLQWP